MTEALTAAELSAVASYLRSEGVAVKGGLRGQLIAGGRSNLTFLLEDGRSRWVLRMPPRSGRTPSAHDVAREYRATRALQGTGVPVPPTVTLCTDESIMGCPFAVTRFVEGQCVQSRAALDEIDEATLHLTIDRLTETLAALHRADYQALGLDHFGRPDNYASRQLRRWAGQWELVAQGVAGQKAVGEELRRRLTARLPQQQRASLVHGDFRIDNTLLRLDDRGVQVAAVVDWELSTIGDPVADVAMMCAYRHEAFDLIVGTKAAWTSERLPDVQDLASRYESAGGARLLDWESHLALAYFKIAVIAAGIDHRHRSGAGAGGAGGTAGAAVGPFLEAGLEALKTTA